MSEKPYQYTLSLTCEDGGKRSITLSNENVCQGGMAASLAFDIARMMAILNIPPQDYEIVAALNSSWWASPLTLMAYLEKKWSGENHWKPFDVTIDIDDLMEEADEKEKALVARTVKSCGWKVKEKTPAVETPKEGEPL